MKKRNVVKTENKGNILIYNRHRPVTKKQLDDLISLLFAVMKQVSIRTSQVGNQEKKYVECIEVFIDL